MNQQTIKRLTATTDQILENAHSLLEDNGHPDWQIKEIHLKSKNDDHRDVVCRVSWENGHRVVKCTPQ